MQLVARKKQREEEREARYERAAPDTRTPTPSPLLPLVFLLSSAGAEPSQEPEGQGA